MIVVLGDLIADLSLRIESFPLDAGEMQQVEFIDLGPGGAANVAITAARMGLKVLCLGEVGDDRFGRVVREGLRSEGIDIRRMVTSPGAQTPVAIVVVDAEGEPAYLGCRGSLRLHSLPSHWNELITAGDGLFADGWADNEHVPAIILEGLQAAKQAGIPSFFDPGPGNPEFDLDWHGEACLLARVILLTAAQAERITGQPDPGAAARMLLEGETELVAIKLGAGGCLLAGKKGALRFSAYPVQALDLTGAGDCFDGAMIYGYLKRLPIGDLGVLANAAGAAKVQKLGTGHSMPSRQEIQVVLDRFGTDFGGSW